MRTQELWQLIHQTLNEEPTPFLSVNKTYGFHLKGEDGGSFGLALKEGVATIYHQLPERTDCTLTMNVNDFKKLLIGKLNSTTAFMMGKLKVQGKISDALKLESLLQHYKFTL